MDRPSGSFLLAVDKVCLTSDKQWDIEQLVFVSVKVIPLLTQPQPIWQSLLSASQALASWPIKA
jgi:hypothetical protein